MIRNIIQKTVMLLFGMFLFFMVLMNKGFAYLHVRIEGVPLFISELMLAVLTLFWLFECIREKRVVLPNDKPFLVGIGIFWAIGCFWTIKIFFDQSPYLIHSLKRSALFYYSTFAFLTYALFREERALKFLLKFVLAGSIGVLAMQYLSLFAPVPGFWPNTVGIADLTAVYFLAVGLGTFFLGGMAWAVIFLTPIRFAFLFSFILFALWVVLLIVYYRHTELFRKAIRVVICAVVIWSVLILMFGVPPSLKRWSFLSVVNKGWLGNVSKDLAPVTKAPVISRNRVSISSPKSPGKTAIPTQATNQIVPPKISEPASPAPGKIAEQAKPELRSTVAPIKPLRNLEKSIIPDSKRKDKGLLVSATPIILQDVKGSERKHDFISPKQLLFLSNNKFLNVSGNFGWRIKVWTEAILKGIQYHFFFGAGLTEPFVATLVCPYHDPQRLQAAIALMGEKYDFMARMSAPETQSGGDFLPPMPLPLTNQEKASEHSSHWYDIDLHNSHLAIFYRFGFLAFLAYVWLIFLTISRLFSGVKQRDGYSFMLLFILMWYVLIAGFNVVLEGPFQAIPFWFVLGFSNAWNRKLPS